jgi:hypothetical protein
MPQVAQLSFGGKMRRRLFVFKRPESLNVWVMSVSVVLAVLGQAVIELVVHALGGKTASSVTWLIGAVLVVLVITVGMLSNIYNRTDELATRLGLSIEYYRLNPGPTPPSVTSRHRNYTRHAFVSLTRCPMALDRESLLSIQLSR